jgi:hypothetical protein
MSLEVSVVERSLVAGIHVLVRTLSMEAAILVLAFIDSGK